MSVLLASKHYGWSELKIWCHTLIITKYKKMYFMSYRYILMFSATITKYHLFLKLMHRTINQKSYKYKLFRFPLDCHLKKELLLILFDLCQMNTDLEVGDHKLTWLGFLKGISSSIKKIFLLIYVLSKKKRNGIVMSLHWENIYTQSYVHIW